MNTFKSLGLLLATVSLGACGRNGFGGKTAVPVATPTAPPAEVKPLETKQDPGGADIATIRSEGGIKSQDDRSQKSTPSVVNVTGRATTPGNVTSVTLPANVKTLVLPPLASRSETPFVALAPGIGGVAARPQCGNGIFIGNMCIAALPLHRWTAGARQILTTLADSSCAQDGEPACGGMRLKGEGFAHVGVAGYVFASSQGASLEAAGVPSNVVVVCHKLQFGEVTPDSFHANPTAAEASGFQSKCLSGAESFLVSKGALDGFKSFTALDASAAVGYFVSP